MEIRTLRRAVEAVLAHSCNVGTCRSGQWIIPTWGVDLLSRFVDTSRVGMGEIPGRKTTKTVDLWHAINVCLSPEERRQFNTWRAKLYDLADKAENNTKLMSEEFKDVEMRARIRDLKNYICEIPWLFS